jgi:hypothetical protein
MAIRPDSTECDDEAETVEFDPRGVHVAFLNVFTYLLQDYRKYNIPSLSFPPQSVP